MANSLTVVGLGEALWDVLPNGRVLGGAPLNVACHVHALLNVAGSRLGAGIVASRVGNDELGDEVVREIARRGMATDYIQRDAAHPTGTVEVALDDGQPTYRFAPDIAWDCLEVTPELVELMETCDAVCFGTLAQRSRQSREAIWQLLDATRGALLLFDVNLRQDFYDRESLMEGCRRATFVKLNELELPIVSELLDLPPGPPPARLSQLFRKFDVRGAVLTRGERGTLLASPDHVFDPSPANYPAAANADAVGAGDACTAAVIVGSLLEWPGHRIANLANHLGAYVASQPGATPELPAAISQMLE